MNGADKWCLEKLNEFKRPHNENNSIRGAFRSTRASLKYKTFNLRKMNMILMFVVFLDERKEYN